MPIKKRKISLSHSVVEPSIGDFGLIESLESARQQSPSISTTESLVIQPKELDDIIKRSSVLLKNEEVKQVSVEEYPCLLERTYTEPNMFGEAVSYRESTIE